MMKRTGILFMALLYTITAAGFALNLHYCGNYVAEVKINAPTDGCAKPMAKKKMRCCKDSRLEVKVKDNHQAQEASALAKLFAVDLPRIPYQYATLLPVQGIAINSFDRGPPGLPVSGKSILTKNCVFRI
jgi:hypothetical protein